MFNFWSKQSIEKEALLMAEALTANLSLEYKLGDTITSKSGVYDIGCIIAIKENVVSVVDQEAMTINMDKDFFEADYEPYIPIQDIC